MPVRCTAVVYNPPEHRSELYEFEVTCWYEAFEQLIVDIGKRHRAHSWYLDDLEIRAFSMIREDD